MRMDPGGAGLPPVGDLNDYGKFGLWHDCLYMAANEFAFPAGHYDGVAFASFSRADLYSGAPLTLRAGLRLPFDRPTRIHDDPEQQQRHGGECGPARHAELFRSESGTIFEFEVRKFTAGRELRRRWHARRADRT